jgi:hypothetical protein
VLRGIHAASASGRHVATIESRGSRVVIRVARIGRRVTPLRRIVRRMPRATSFGVALATPDVAWLASNDDRGEVAVAGPGRSPRVVSRAPASGLVLEDGRTLRWQGDVFGRFGFFDLRQVPCPSRTGFAPVLSTDRVVVTRRRYRGTIVLRGCDQASRRDVVAGQQYAGDPELDTWLDVVGADRTWIVVSSGTFGLHDECPSGEVVATDVASGRSVVTDLVTRCATAIPPPQAGSFAVTDRGVVAWTDDIRLLAAVGPRVTELDRGETIAELHAEGEAVAWTHDGAARSAVPRNLGLHPTPAIERPTSPAEDPREVAATPPP